MHPALGYIFPTVRPASPLILIPKPSNNLFKHFMQAYTKDCCQPTPVLAFLVGFQKDILYKLFKDKNPDLYYSN